MILNRALNRVWDKMPTFDERLAEGVSYHQMMDSHKRIEALMRIAFDRSKDPRLPEGFEFNGLELLTPEQEYVVRAEDAMAKYDPKRKPPAKNKQGYQMAQTDTYLTYAKFCNEGKVWNRPIGHLFVRRGGYAHLNGTRYQISAVLKTRGVSLTQKGYFVEFNSSKVFFEWMTHSFVINGENVHAYMPYSTFLHNSAKKRSSKTLVPPLACWLFAKFGVRETFDRFYGITDLQILDLKDPLLNEIDKEYYAVCRSGIPHKGKAAKFAVVIPRDQMTPEAQMAIGTMFYTTRIDVDQFTIENMEESDFWKLMLGYSILGVNCDMVIQRIVSEMCIHFNNIEQMMDIEFRQELLAEDIRADDIYDFINYIMGLMAQKSANESSDIASLWGRYVTCMEYVTNDIRYGIFKARWDLINAASDATGQNVGNTVNIKKLHRLISKRLGPNTIERITSGHSEVSVYMTASDNMVIGLSSHVIEQSDTRKRGKAQGGGGKKSIDLNDPSKHLHASFQEVGSAVNLTKASPICWSNINMCMKIGPDFKILRNPELIDITNEVQLDISQKGM